MKYGIPNERTEKGFDLIKFLYGPLIKKPNKYFDDKKIDVLDVGTGSGYLLRLLRKKKPNWNLKGIDPSEALSLNKEKGIELISGYAEELPFKDKSFDLVLSKSSLCYWNDVDKSLREIKRVLKDDGKFYMMDVNRSKWFKILLIIFGKIILGKSKKDMSNFSDRAYSIKEVKVIMERVGLKYNIRRLFGGAYFLVWGSK